MNEWKILYAGDFPITKSSGRSRATRQKIDALHQTENNVLSVFPPQNKFLRLVHVLTVDLILIYYFLKFRPDIFISRGFTGILTLQVAKFLSIFSVREMHAVAQEETDYEFSITRKILSFKWVVKSVYNRIVLRLDRTANMRIFNHPALKSWFSKNYFYSEYDIYAYNGYSETDISDMPFQEARSLFNLAPYRIYLTFIGSVSKWHGVDKLLQLSRALKCIDPNIYVIIGGGRFFFDEIIYDNVINITPLESKMAAHLICASDACLLTVADFRTSPGSPLKLYDYIGHGKLVISQREIVGYSDEATLYGKCVLVDFDQPNAAAEAIVSYLKDNTNQSLCVDGFERFTWNERIKVWLSSIERARNNIR